MHCYWPICVEELILQTERCGGEIEGTIFLQIILFMIFRLSLRAADAAECPHFKEGKH